MLKDYIRKWVFLDNQQKKINQQIKELRDEKNILTTNILDYISNNNLNISKINISDGKLSFIEIKQANVITYKFLNECFNEYFNDTNKSNELLEFIKNKRAYSSIRSIKRT